MSITAEVFAAMEKHSLETVSSCQCVYHKLANDYIEMSRKYEAVAQQNSKFLLSETLRRGIIRRLIERPCLCDGEVGHDASSHPEWELL